MTRRTRARIAIVGAGLIGQKHIAVAKELAELDAIIDPSSAAKQSAADSGTKWYSELQDYLEKSQPDGLVIASPNALHLEHGRAAIDAGVPALIEKPLAESAIAANELAEYSALKMVPLLVGHHRRYSTVTTTAKRLIDDGALGRIVATNALFWLHKPTDYFDAQWRTKSGGGPTYINLIHDIDTLQHLCGKIVRVHAKESNAIRGYEVEDTSAVIVEYETGALGTIAISDTISSPWSWELTAGENPLYPKTDQSCYLIGGTRGSLSLPDMNFWRHEGVPSWSAPIDREIFSADPCDPIKSQFLHLLEVISGSAVPLVTAAEGARNIEVLDAIKASAFDGSSKEVGGMAG